MKQHYIPDRFALYNYTKTDMDEYHKHIYEAFGDIDWEVLMFAFIDTICHKCESEEEAKELIDDFIYNLIQGHYNT